MIAVKPPRRCFGTVPRRRRSQFGFEGAVRVGHHAEHIAAGVLDAGYVVDRAVGVVDVAEDHLALALDPGQGLGVGEEVSVAVAWVITTSRWPDSRR